MEAPRNLAAENEGLMKRLRRCEASLSTWDDRFDSRYWTEYPAARAEIEAMGDPSHASTTQTVLGNQT